MIKNKYLILNLSIVGIILLSLIMGFDWVAYFYLYFSSVPIIILMHLGLSDGQIVQIIFTVVYFISIFYVWRSIKKSNLIAIYIKNRISVSMFGILLVIHTIATLWLLMLIKASTKAIFDIVL